MAEQREGDLSNDVTKNEEENKSGEDTKNATAAQNKIVEEKPAIGEKKAADKFSDSENEKSDLQPAKDVTLSTPDCGIQEVQTVNKLDIKQQKDGATEDGRETTATIATMDDVNSQQSGDQSDKDTADERTINDQEEVVSQDVVIAEIEKQKVDVHAKNSGADDGDHNDKTSDVTDESGQPGFSEVPNQPTLEQDQSSQNSSDVGNNLVVNKKRRDIPMSAKSVTFAEDSHEKRDIVEEEDEDKQSVGYEKYVLEADKKERDAELDTNDDKKEQDAEGDTNNEAQVDEIKPEVPSTGLFQTAVSEEKIEEAKQRNISTVGTEAMAVDLWGRELVPAESMQQVIENRAAEHYEKALQLQERGKHYKAILSFDKAINLQSRKVEYYINRGESYLQVCDFQSAILNYKKACVLDPENDDHYSKLAFIYFFHGQTLFDQHKFSDALESFSRAAEMKPEIVGYHTRSVACLAALQRHGECLALVNKRLEVERENPDLYIMRARLHELFRNTTLCYYDLKDALQLDPNQEEALIMMGKMEMKANEYKKQAIQMNLGGKYKESLQKVSMAIETNPTVPEYHVLRGALHRRLQDFNSAIDDYLLALDKTDHDEEHPTYQDAQRQLLLTYNDFAVECFSKEFYDEAIILLNKAIKGEKREKGLYINRGDCFFRQNALQFALADYHQALELDSSDSWIRARIANIHNEFGLQDYEERSFQEAEARFTVAIQHNPRIAQYYVSRSKARFMMENLGGSRTDLLMGLHLEPGNDEIMSLLPRLFPGKTVGDVMKSKAARAAKLTVENAVVMASPVKLPTLERTSEDGDDETELKDEKGAPSTAVPSTAYSYQTTYKPGFPDLKACMDEMEFHRHIVKGKKRITQKVKKMLYGSSTLKNDRPRLAPQPPARPVAVRGGALGSQGMVSVVNNGAKPQQAGWRSFSLGISPS